MKSFICSYCVFIILNYLKVVSSQVSDNSFRTNDERRLVDYLMRNYDNTIRPVKNASNAVVIRLGITLTQIFDLDEKNQVLTTNVWLDQEWIDEFLTWNSSLFGYLPKIRIPCEKIWKPDIVLYNNADDYTRGYMNSRAIIEPNGNVFWPPPTKFRSTCPVDVTYFPFDDQKCTLKLGSWIYDGLQVDVLNRTADVDMSNYVQNGEWDLLEANIKRSVVYYPCCPEPFPDVTITLTIRRKILYYTYNVILPCMMLSVLTLLVFCIPPDSGEKIALGVTVLLAFSVFMLAISEKLPETSESIPLLGIYLTVVMAITSISVIMTVIVLNFHYRGPVKKGIPKWFKTLLNSEVGKKWASNAQTKTTIGSQLQSNSCNAYPTNPSSELYDISVDNQYNRDLKLHKSLDLTQRFAISTESLINIEDNYKLLLNLNRTKSCNRISSKPNINAMNDKIMATHEELLDACKYLLWKNELKVSNSAAVHEWRLLALFIDKILFWIFFIVITVSSLLFLVVIPVQQRGFPYLSL